MSITLYDVAVPTFRQILGAVAGLLDKAEAHCRETGLAESELINARLAEDMFPFCYQVKSTAVHSLGAIEGVRKGAFSPDMTEPPQTLDALKERIAGARSAIDALDPAEVNALAGRDVFFEFRDFRIPFTAEKFILSFSFPNFYFHATTAYDIVRWKGATIGKRDFMGQMQIKC